MLLTRALSAVVLIPVTIAVLYLGSWPLLVLVMAVVSLGYYEFAAMFRRAGHRPFVILGIVLSLLTVASAYFPLEDATVVLTAAVIATLSYALLVKRANRNVFYDWSLTLAGIVYVAWLFRYGLLLRSVDSGLWWTIGALAATWAADTGAYLTGRAVGRHKMYPHISPGKTWEGFVGGLALGIVAAALVGVYLLGIHLWQGIGLGVLVAVVAVVGDLAESLVKRAAGVKDSGSLIPGHGGMLDRVDSLLFVLPVVYYFHRLVVS